MNRIARVTRIQIVNRWGLLTVPWMVLGSSFLINLMIFAAVGDGTPPSHRVTGGLSSIYVTMFVVHLITITQVFPFAVSLSTTRRAFFAATSLIIVVQAVGFGAVLTLAKLLEHSTGGWGVQMRFFDVPFVTQHNPLTQLAVFAVPFVALSSIGILIGAVFRRWKQPGLLGMTIAALLAGGTTVALIILFKWGSSLGSFFTTQPPSVLLAVYPLALALLAGGTAYRLLQRSRV